MTLIRYCLLTLVCAAAGGCNRYEYRADHCPPEAAPGRPLYDARGPSRASVIDGTAVDAEGRGVVGHVVVTLDAGSRAVRADSNGRFRLDSVAPGMHRLTLRRVGYATRSVDSVAVSASAGASVRVPLRAMAFDECGYAMLRTRKPWWKWW